MSEPTGTEAFSVQQITHARHRLAPLSFRRFIPNEASATASTELSPADVQDKCFSVLGYLEEYYRTPDHVVPDIQLEEGDDLNSLERQLDNLLLPNNVRSWDAHDGTPDATNEEAPSSALHRDVIGLKLSDLLSQPQVRERFESEFDREFAHFQAARRPMREVRDIDRVTEKLRLAIYRRYLDSTQQHGTLTQSAADQIGLFQGKLDELKAKRSGIVETASPSTLGYLEAQRMLDYKKQLEENGVVLTPSRLELIDRMSREAIAGNKIFLVGSTGTGKTKLGLYVLNSLTGGYEIINWHEGTTPRDVFGYRELWTDDEGGVQSGMKTGPVPKALERGVGVLHDEYTGGSTRTQLATKFMQGARPGDRIQIPGFNGQVFDVTNNFVEILTGNPKDERTKQREDMDPAILRELTGVEVSYMPAAEMADVIKATLIEENGVLGLSKAEADYIRRLSEAAQMMQQIHNRDFAGFTPAMKTSLGIDPQNNTETTLNTNFLDPGTLFKLFGEWKLSRARGDDFATYMQKKLGEFINDPKTLSVPEERKTLLEVLHSFGLTRDAVSPQIQVEIEEQEKGYILPSEMAAGETQATSNPMQGRSERTADSLQEHELREAESYKWREFLGQEIEVPPPPQELLDALAKAEELGIRDHLKPVYFPQREFKKDDDYPGWIKTPNDTYFWNEIGPNKKLAQDAAKLGGFWAVVDITAKPNAAQDSNGNYNGSQVYANDPWASILEDLRAQGIGPNAAANSRAKISPNEQYEHFYPALQRLLELPEHVQARNMREIEFNILGNRDHPEWGETSTYEWMHDQFGSDGRLIGGFSAYGGLSNVHWNFASTHFDYAGFRPLIVFSS